MAWEDHKVETKAPLEYTLNIIGDYTLLGMLAYRDIDGRWKLTEIAGRDITVTYNKCVLQPSALCRDIAWLYKHGAKHVALIEKAEKFQSLRPMPRPGVPG